MRIPRLVAMFAWLLLPAAATANPIMMETNHGVQVPETMHVQISYMCESDNQEPGWCNLPTGVEKDGALLTSEFQGPTGVEINGGSGIGTYYAWQVCDCDVAVGGHSYKLLFDGENWLGGAMTITVVDPPPAVQEPQPMPEAGIDVAPWNIPESPWPKGLDCEVFCEDAPVGPGEDTAPAGEDTVQPGPNTDTLGPGVEPAPATPEVVDDEGKTCGIGAGVAVPGILLMLGLLALLYRRRTA
ncbi:MAG: hypothetical protein ABIK09_18850 [Pseudomonadota bacterium]